jgi:hypothetical protein
MEDSCGQEVAMVAVDDELEAVLEVVDVAMEPIVVGVYGCLGVELLLCSHECCLGDAGIDVEVLLGIRWFLKTPYLIACIGEDVARNLAANGRRRYMIS